MKKTKLIYLLAFSSISIMAFCAINKNCTFFKFNKNAIDSVYENKFQKNIIQYENVINDYNQMVFDSMQIKNNQQNKTTLVNQLDSIKNNTILQFEKSITTDSLKKIFKILADSASKNKYNFSNINSALIKDFLLSNNDSIVINTLKSSSKTKFEKADSSKIKKVLLSIQSEYIKVKTAEKNFISAKAEDSLLTQNYLNIIIKKDALYSKYKTEVYPSFEDLLSYDTSIIAQYFYSGGKKYFKLIVSNNDSFDIQISTSNSKENGRTIKSLWDKLYKEKKQPFFLMNAGMYNKEYDAQGLFIQDGKIINPIDANNKSNDGNFYLYPNGVFYIDTANAKTHFGIMETQDFVKNSSKSIKYATQSGPMLVHNNKIHKSFTPKSKNVNIRNGVGVMVNAKGVQKIVFVISEDAVSFHEMATVFKDYLHCREALYLDGTVSRYYFNNNKKVFGALDNGQRLGPILAVFKKKSIKTQTKKTN